MILMFELGESMELGLEKIDNAYHICFFMKEESCIMQSACQINGCNNVKILKTEK